jgi:NAD(P)-dependent dehydrogenase (short-subunit alcohol dehydrogenase family)
MDLSGRGALVTGGASGIGAAAVRRLAAAGGAGSPSSTSTATGRRRWRPEVGGVALPADVTDPTPSAASWRMRRRRSGGSTSCCSTPGSRPGSPAWRTSTWPAYRRIMGVNVDHVVFGLTAAGAGAAAARAAARSSRRPRWPGSRPCRATRCTPRPKHAVVGYVRSVAPSLALDGIRVAAVCPGFADTPLIAHAKEQFGDFPLLTADDVASAVEQILDRGRAGGVLVRAARPRARAVRLPGCAEREGHSSAARHLGGPLIRS